MTRSAQRHRSMLLAVFVVLAVLGAACGDDDDDGGDSSGSSDGAGTSVADASSDELEVWQTDLNAVGCYAGAVDGVSGPQTEAAIRAFQEAKGLTVDGLLGPQTEGALTDAVAAGEIVCTGAEGGVGDQVSLTATSYSNDFAITSCSLNADVSNLDVQAEVNALMLTVQVVEGQGTLAVSGGTETDGIELNGEVTSLDVDGRTFTATGTFGEPNNAGEDFTLTGPCPE